VYCLRLEVCWIALLFIYTHSLVVEGGRKLKKRRRNLGGEQSRY
jgi:hypothetical protein